MRKGEKVITVTSKLIPVTMPDGLIVAIDISRKSESRASWMRRACEEKLERDGVILRAAGSDDIIPVMEQVTK